MGKKITSGRIILWTIIISLSLVIGVSYYKINKEKHDIIYKVLNKKILDSAEKCFNEDNCKSNMTLGELINKGYLESMVDPDTKEYYSTSSIIKLENDHFVFIPYY